MKECISRLITFINHLWRTFSSTLVERWLRKHATGYLIIRNGEVIMNNHISKNKFIVCCDDETGMISLAKEARDDD